MKTTVLIHRSDRAEDDSTRIQPLEFSRIPCVGELVHLGGIIPMMRVLSVIHTPLGDEYQAEIMVGIADDVEKFRKALSL